MKKSKLAEKAKLASAQVAQELGVDINKYNDQEGIGKIADLFMFQSYIVKKLYRPVLISFALYIAGFFILDLVHVEYFLYGVLGLVFFLIIALLAGINMLLSNLKKDLITISNFSFSTLNYAVTDLQSLNIRAQSELQNPLTKLFEGIVYSLVLPPVSNKVEKLPLVGNYTCNGIDTVMQKLVVQVRKKEDTSNFKINLNHNGFDNKLNRTQDFVGNLSSQSEKVISKSISVLQLPFKIGVFVTVCLQSIFLLIIN